ncbi:hypothetical protein [Burkholderia stabilis]|uniref:Uncharacterized protein n=1 Tax=Burkholderia stabilis TaxID=95485 RepID=A0A1Y1BR19_9BURK|nr:hypothetical protein [Burkholderia stabilis]BAX60027.1 hypothetical protein BSFP_028730 [Burkholderia stabilis]
MRVSDPEYQKHVVFDELKRYTQFYESLADGVFQFVSVGTTAICNIDTYVYSAIAGTIASVGMVLRDGRINDAYSLLRKYYDSAVINVYSNLYLKEHYEKSDFTAKTLLAEQINGWLHGRVKLPEYRVMSNYIRSSERFRAINSLLYADDTYKKIRDRCNDNTHYNFFENVMLNNREVYIRNRGTALEQIRLDAIAIFVLHFSYVVSVNDHYVMSSDYMDHMECGLTPPDGCEHWVAPYAQEAFDSILRVHRLDLAEAILQNSAMQFDG